MHFYQSVNVCHTVLNIQACYDSSDVMRKLKPKKTILSIHNQKIEGIILCRQLTANQGNVLHSTWLTPAFAIWENSWFALSLIERSGSQFSLMLAATMRDQLYNQTPYTNIMGCQCWEVACQLMFLGASRMKRAWRALPRAVSQNSLLIQMFFGYPRFL